MKGKKRKTAVMAMAAVLSIMTIGSPLAVMAQETAPAAPAVTREGDIQKETAPAIRLPENLRAKAGTALKDVALPRHWTWADDSTIIADETAEYPARLRVDDAAYDYSEVEGYNAGGGLCREDGFGHCGRSESRSSRSSTGEITRTAWGYPGNL